MANENLKVNAKTDILEFKRKHNLLIDGLGVSEDGNLALFENITDKDGHKRFIEGNITCDTITGVTQNYGKWALSGSHLLIVLSCTFADASVITTQRLAFVNLPKWIDDKIVALFGRNIIYSVFPAYASDGTTQNLACILDRDADNKMRIYIGNLTLTKERNIRITFDLLIDNESAV